MRRPAFHFDASACSGCKACQVACKDRHALPLDVLWRRVYEVSGGGWTEQGSAWVSDVYAYNLSLSCNHCADAVCTEVCPTGAMHVRADGIVLIDRERCVGCRYCTWACPYGAPQYDAGAGTVSKCTLCVDDVDAGLPPACVAACPMRALTLVPGDVPAAAGAVFPLPPDDRTRPALLIAPHAAAARAAADPLARVANREEVERAHSGGERSLVVFTISAQLAIGTAWSAALHTVLSGTLPGTLGLALGVAFVLAVAAAGASLAHLGRPLRALRALGNLRTSWLSREVLAIAAFALACAGAAAGYLRYSITATSPAAVAALLGIILLWCMLRVYTGRTLRGPGPLPIAAEFLLATALPGALLYALLLAATGRIAVDPLLLLAALAVALPAAVAARHRLYRRMARAQP